MARRARGSATFTFDFPADPDEPITTTIQRVIDGEIKGAVSAVDLAYYHVSGKTEENTRFSPELPVEMPPDAARAEAARPLRRVVDPPA